MKHTDDNIFATGNFDADANMQADDNLMRTVEHQSPYRDSIGTMVLGGSYP
jgi:hypothetical protein